MRSRPVDCRRETKAVQRQTVILKPKLRAAGRTRSHLSHKQWNVILISTALLSFIKYWDVLHSENDSLKHIALKLWKTSLNCRLTLTLPAIGCHVTNINHCHMISRRNAKTCCGDLWMRYNAFMILWKQASLLLEYLQILGTDRLSVDGTGFSGML